MSAEATQLRFTVDLTGTRAAQTSYLDLAQCLSIINRRTYDSSRNYYISGMQLVATANAFDNNKYAAAFQFSTLPDSWALRNAYQELKKKWQKMGKKVLAINPGLEGKWRHFRMYMTDHHWADNADDGSGTGTFNNTQAVDLNLLPMELNPSQGQWLMSRFVPPDWDEGDESDFYVTCATGEDRDQGSGGTYNFLCGSMMEGFKNSRPIISEDTNQPPADFEDSWWYKLEDIGGQDPELLEVMETEGSEAPYNVDQYPGCDGNGILTTQQYGLVSNQAAGGAGQLVQNLPGFYCPLGYLAITPMSDSTVDDLNPRLIITMAPGSHLGVHAPTFRQRKHPFLEA